MLSSLRTATVIALAASLTIGNASSVLDAKKKELTAAITLDAGTFQGTDILGVSKFLGIPYALPPLVFIRYILLTLVDVHPCSTGTRRFALPQANAPYAGTHDANTYGPSCPGQSDPSDLLEGLSGTLNFVKDAVFGESTSAAEDCR